MKNTWTGRTNYHGNEITWTLNIVDGEFSKLAKVTINQQGFNAKNQTTTEVPPFEVNGDAIRYYMAVMLSHFVRSYCRDGFVAPASITVNRD